MSLVVPPYPPARYTKDEPEVSAWLRRGDRPPDYTAPAARYHYLANQQTDRRRLRPLPRRHRPAAADPARISTARCRRPSSCSREPSSSTTASTGSTAPRRLPVCPARRRPWFPQRGRRADVAVDAVCSRRAARALFRGHRPARRHDPRRASQSGSSRTTISSSSEGDTASCGAQCRRRSGSVMHTPNPLR